DIVQRVMVAVLERAEERIEGGRRALVGRRDQGAARSRGAVAAGFDSRQVRFEGDTGVVDPVTWSGARAGEQDRLRVQERIAVRPDGLVTEAVEAGVGIGTAVDMDAHRLGTREAEIVVTVGRRGVAAESFGVARGAGNGVAAGVEPERGSRDGVGALAVLEVPDLAGEGDVVGVR